mmetsp:Transcript_1428/g.2544  ORF Transcript_1428/g.2544 Transcript_1428/m.2544 type:complete len:478 (+) Transcript_1428:119-1552(+)
MAEGRCRRLADLPSGILENVASFLVNPSRAIFAAVLATSDSPSDTRSAIVGDQWDTLDFGEIEKDLAAKLSDDDIHKILLCTDAVNRVKRLMLTNCTHIKGVGLEPLRGSIIIEQIDLSLVAYHESPVLDPAPPISWVYVLPILDSIISQAGYELKLLEFPKHWLDSSDPIQFLDRYLHMWSNRFELTCLSTGCNEIVNEVELCCKCMNYYCDFCVTDDDERMIAYCDKCEKRYCYECVAIKDCRCCHQSYCSGHCDVSFHECCEGCGKICPDCDTEERRCHRCKDRWCDDCGGEVIQKCSFCNIRLCNCCDTNFKYCENDSCLWNFCGDCLSNSKGCIKCNKCEKVWCDECADNYCGDGFYFPNGHPKIGNCDGCDCNVCFHCNDYWSDCGRCNGIYCVQCWDRNDLRLLDGCYRCQKPIQCSCVPMALQCLNVCEDCFECGFPDNGCPGCIRNAEKRLDRLNEGNKSAVDTSGSG